MKHRIDIAEFKNGWRTLLGCMIAASIGTIGFSAYAGGVFVPALMAEGFAREQLAFASFTLSASVALLAPFAGAFMDRRGALGLIAFAVVGEAVMFVVLGSIPAQFPFYLAAIVGLAVLGVGTTPPGFTRTVSARFEKSRGLALGITISGLGIMAISAPIVWNAIIEANGWRAGYYAMAAAVLLLGGGGALLIASDKGGRAAAAARKTAAHEKRGSWAALGRPLFWVLLVAFLLPGLFGGGYLFHLVGLLRERGFSPADAALVQSLMGFAVLIGRLTSGAAMDRFFAPYVAAVAFAISAAGCFFLLSDAPVLVCAAALGIGLTIGAELDIMAYVISRYFGVDSMGRLYGLAYGGLILCSGFSPVLISWMAEGDDFTRALIYSGIGTGAGGFILLFAPPFDGRRAPRETPLGAAAKP